MKTSDLAASAMLLLASVPAHAVTTTTQDVFSSSSVFKANAIGGTGMASYRKAFSSSWGSGDVSLGTGITNVLGTRYGYDAYLNTSGSAGMTFTASAGLGAIDVDFTASGQTKVTPLASNEFLIQSLYSNSGAPKFTIGAPEASVQVDANFSLKNNFFGRACFVACESWGTPGGANLGSASVNATMLGLSTKAGGTLTVLGQKFETAPQITIGNYGSIAIMPPTAVTSNAGGGFGNDRIISFNLDLAQMTSDSLLSGFPLSKSTSFGIGSIDYEILSVDAVLAVGLIQGAFMESSAVRKTSFYNYDGSAAYVPVARDYAYALIPGATFSEDGGPPQSCAATFGDTTPAKGVALEGPMVDCFRVKGVDFTQLHTIDNLGADGMIVGDGFADISQLDVVTETIHSLALGQSLSLTLNAGLDISALSANFKLGYGNISVSKPAGPLFEASPSFAFNHRFFHRDLVRSERSFEIVSLTGNAASPTPEPASWAMLITGFGLTGAAMRRRRMLPLTA